MSLETLRRYGAAFTEIEKVRELFPRIMGIKKAPLNASRAFLDFECHRFQFKAIKL